MPQRDKAYSTQYIRHFWFCCKTFEYSFLCKITFQSQIFEYSSKMTGKVKSNRSLICDHSVLP